VRIASRCGEYEIHADPAAERDPRLITVRRGGTLTDEHHRLRAEWVGPCAEHVLHLFEREQSRDTRPREPSMSVARGSAARFAWGRTTSCFRGECRRTRIIRPGEVRRSRGRASRGAGTRAAHDLGAAAYAIRAVGASASAGETEAARIRNESRSEKDSPSEVGELVLGDQRSRSPICWNVFDD
jgi:hypothetical protein